MDRDSGIRIFLCGDVMTGRGIDQILPYPSEPTLHESYIQNAVDYVSLAERVHGPIQRSVAPAYIWGDALAEFARLSPQLRHINLETSITTSGHWEPKGINYRMHPRNIDCLTVAKIQSCTLANNHVLDWGEEGLKETLKTLHRAGIQTIGAGADLDAARSPAVFHFAEKGRVVALAMGTDSSGIPSHWAADRYHPGVDFLTSLSNDSLKKIASRVFKIKMPRDLVIISIHWGGNWGYEIPQEHQDFARALIDEAGVDIVHGHSSHHVLGLEVYKRKLILYGCGDLISDYEGIGGSAQFRPDLSLMYFPDFDLATGTLVALQMVPMQMRNFRLRRVSPTACADLAMILKREGARFGTTVRLANDHTLHLEFPKSN